MKDWYKPYDSPEEAYVSWYLDELVEGGYVLEYEHQPRSKILSPKSTYFYIKELKTKTKNMMATLLQEHVYTADFLVYWSREGCRRFVKSPTHNKAPFWSDNTEWHIAARSVLEVKPSYDQNNMTRLFTINQKWMYDKYGIYVQKIIPQKLFEDTFTPQRYLMTDTGKQKRKINFATRTLEEYIKLRENDN